MAHCGQQIQAVARPFRKKQTRCAILSSWGESWFAGVSDCAAFRKNRGGVRIRTVLRRRFPCSGAPKGV